MRRAPVALAAALACALGAASALGALSGRIYRDPPLRIYQLELPRDWQAVPPAQIGYPRVLLRATAKASGARMTFAAQRVLPGTGAEVLAADARALLGRQGWEDPRVTQDGDLVRLEAKLDGGRRLLRQIYLVDGDLAYVLTIVAPPEHRERALHDFEETWRSLVLIPMGAQQAPLGDGGLPDAGDAGGPGDAGPDARP
jgi:hypothetical protein